jgi:hypothetical protein
MAMTVPAQPTVASIATSALTRFYNGVAPETDELTLAETDGFEKVKRDLMALGRKWHSLLKTSYSVTIANVGKYANPSDYKEDRAVGLMLPLLPLNATPTLSVVTSASNVTLSATEAAVLADVQGSYLLLISGTGANQAEQIITYSATSKVAVLRAALGTLPVVGDGYRIVKEVVDLHKWPDKLFYKFATPPVGEPDHYMTLPNTATGDTALMPIPGGVYGLRRSYYADLLLMDADVAVNPLFGTILRKWQLIFEQGVYVWKLGEDDDRWERENGIYQGLLMALMVKELDGYTPPAAQQGGQ